MKTLFGTLLGNGIRQNHSLAKRWRQCRAALALFDRDPHGKRSGIKFNKGRCSKAGPRGSRTRLGARVGRRRLMGILPGAKKQNLANSGLRVFF